MDLNRGTDIEVKMISWHEDSMADHEDVGDEDDHDDDEVEMTTDIHL